MPAWFEVVIGVVGLIGTILGTFGITSYISIRMQYEATKKNK